MKIFDEKYISIQNNVTLSKQKKIFNIPELIKKMFFISFFCVILIYYSCEIRKTRPQKNNKFQFHPSKCANFTTLESTNIIENILLALPFPL